MKKTIYAKVVAKALSFPDLIEIQFQPVHPDERPLGTTIYKDGPYSWETVKRKFWIDEPYAAECEKLFEQGFAALIRRPCECECEGDWPESGV